MNPVLLRKQLQENAADLQDFCKELKNWGEEMKRKEEALKNGDSEGTSSQNKTEHKKVKKSDKSSTKPHKESISKKPAAKIGTTDYAAWDKFDADAECEKLNDDISTDSELTDESNDNTQDLALIEKEKGNKFVKDQKWDEAIKCYSKAIQYYPYDPIFYANRALCSLKKNRFEDAENDCSLSLKLDNTYVKAYQRRAAAREGLNKLEHAEFDLLKVLELEPKNQESKEALGRIQKRLGNTERVSDQRPVSKFTASRNKSSLRTPATSSGTVTSKLNERSVEFKKVTDTSESLPTWFKEDDVIPVKAINKPPHMRSKKPLKRIKIVEKDSSMVECEEVVRSEPEAIKQHVFEKKEKTESRRDVSIFKKERDDFSAFRQSEKSDHSTAFPRPDEKSCSITSDDFKVIEKEPPDPKDVKNTSNISISHETSKIMDKKANTELAKPKTSVQFNLTWKNLQSTEHKYEYLKRVDPQDLPKIFLNSLESGVFSGMLEVLVKHFVENKNPVFDILEYLTQVKRFGAITMFMSPSDKKNLWKLFDYIKENEQKNKEEVDRLINKYEL